MYRFNTQPHEGGCYPKKLEMIKFIRFNTQPHEGGCGKTAEIHRAAYCFNTQPHEGGCAAQAFFRQYKLTVSTHSRTKAAAH